MRIYDEIAAEFHVTEAVFRRALRAVLAQAYAREQKKTFDAPSVKGARKQGETVGAARRRRA